MIHNFGNKNIFELIQLLSRLYRESRIISVIYAENAGRVVIANPDIEVKRNEAGEWIGTERE